MTQRQLAVIIIIIIGFRQSPLVSNLCCDARVNTHTVALCCTSESSVRTKREKHDLDYKKQVLSLAKQHRSAADMHNINRYHMPANDKVVVTVTSV